MVRATRRSGGCAAALTALTLTVSWQGAMAGGDGGPLPDTLLGAPQVLGLIHDGDEAVSDTIYVYLDGCPILSITPPPDGYGDPKTTFVQSDGGCRPAGVGGITPAHVSAVGGGAGEGIHVKVKRGDPGAAAEGQGAALILDLSSVYPDRPEPAGNPRFWVPGVFGDPSGDLTMAGTGPLWTGGPEGEVPAGLRRMGPRIAGDGDDGSGLATVPLPATFLLLLIALKWLRGVVRRG